MSIPVWVLLLFAGWTLVSLLGSVGVFRWSRVLTRRAQIAEFQADRVQESRSAFYKRSMRAHANCVENLPVYGAIVLAIVVSGAQGFVLDALAITLICFRVMHTFVHVAFEQTNFVTSVRFTLFFAQYICMALMGVITAIHAA